MSVERTALPVGDGATLQDAIEYYCGLVGITPSFSAALLPYVSTKTVNYIGWVGDVWQKLKELCAAVSASDSEDIPMEMIIDVDTLEFRIAKTTPQDLLENAASISLDIDSFDASQEVVLTYYKTDYRTNGVVTQQAQGQNLETDVIAVGISDQLQVDSGQKLTKRFQINASLATVNQPTIVSTISTIPYPDGGTGEYVVVGSDDLPIDPDQWIAEGGSLTVALTETPGEIEITIQAPEIGELIHAGDANVGYAPYKIGVESSGGATYPALYITGDGVFFERKTKTFLSGASDDYTSEVAATGVDNIFLTSQFDLSTRGVAAAQAVCGPRVTLSVSNPVDLTMGSSLGATFNYLGNRYRVETTSFSAADASFTAIADSDFDAFDTIWTGKTFADFTDVMSDPALSPNDYITFNEFTAIPLNEEIE